MEKKEELEEFEVTLDEVAKSLTFCIAGESGVTEEISPEDAGRKGAFISDLTETAKSFLNGEISQKEVEERIIESTVSYAVAPIIDKFVDKTLETTIDKIIDKLEEKELILIAEALKQLKNPLKNFIKNRLMAPTVRVAKKIWSKTKVHAKKILKREK